MKKPKDYLLQNSEGKTIHEIVKQAQVDAIKQMVIRCVLNAHEYLGAEMPPLVALPMVHDIAEKLIKEIEE